MASASAVLIGKDSKIQLDFGGHSPVRRAQKNADKPENKQQESLDKIASILSQKQEESSDSSNTIKADNLKKESEPENFWGNLGNGFIKFFTEMKAPIVDTVRAWGGAVKNIAKTITAPFAAVWSAGSAIAGWFKGDDKKKGGKGEDSAEDAEKAKEEEQQGKLTGAVLDIRDHLFGMDRGEGKPEEEKKTVWDYIKRAGAILAGAIGAVLGPLKWLAAALGGGLKLALKSLAAALTPLGLKIAAVAAVGYGLYKIYEFFKEHGFVEGMKIALGKVGDAFTAVGKFFGGVIDRIQLWLPSWMGGISQEEYDSRAEARELGVRREEFDAENTQRRSHGLREFTMAEFASLKKGASTVQQHNMTSLLDGGTAYSSSQEELQTSQMPTESSIQTQATREALLMGVKAHGGNVQNINVAVKNSNVSTNPRPLDGTGGR